VSAGHTTIVTPIKRSEVEKLKAHLRADVDPAYDPVTILKCKEFPFDRIPGLHFCSFTVLDEDEEFEPSLIFEATFDGTREFFLDALLSFALAPLDRVYRHCRDYPVSHGAAPKLIKQYLIAHDTRAQILFRGSPGRTVAQIDGESKIREDLASYVSERWRSPKVMPSSYAGFQQELQQKVIFAKRGNRWATQMAAVPWEVRGRKLIALAAGLLVLAVACLISVSTIWVTNLILARLGHGHLPAVAEWSSHVGELSRWLFKWLGGRPLLVPSVPLATLIILWFGLRLAELFMQFEDPRANGFFLRYVVHLLIIFRYFTLALIVGFSVLLLDKNDPLDRDFLKWLADNSPTRLESVALLAGALVAFLLLQYWVTSLRLAIQFEQLDPRREILRRWNIDVARFAMVLVAAFAVFVIGLSIPHNIGEWLGPLVLPRLKTLMVVAIHVFIGLIIAYAIAGILFLVVRMKELADRRNFVAADDLVDVDNSAVYAREEGGTNTYQNHLASLTHVKPGFLRRWFLRLTLLVIGLLSRFWFNVGELGGIPTILSARWVLLDNGRRLVFLDHYGGAWDSYLNEFIDMSAVIGLNGIWTNTFVKARGKKYAFPQTRFYFWMGAQVERPFKAYVRQSQIETIAWYSAYPRPSTVNINTRTDVRQSLFKSLPPHEIDALLQKL